MLAATASVGPVSWLLQLGAHTMRSASSAGEPSFIFSLVDEKNPELFYCVVMRKDTPKDEITMLQDILGRLTTFHTARPKGPGLPQVNTSQINEVLRKGAEDTSLLLKMAGEGAREAFQRAAEMHKKYAPAPKEQPLEVDSALRDKIAKSKQATAAGAAVARGVATGMQAATVEIGASLMNVGSGGKNTPKAGGSSGGDGGGGGGSGSGSGGSGLMARPEVKAAGGVGMEILRDVAAVRDALVNSVGAAWGGFKVATVDVFEHQYGAQAGGTVADSCDVVEGIASMGMAMKLTQPTQVLLTSTKETVEGATAKASGKDGHLSQGQLAAEKAALELERAKFELEKAALEKAKQDAASAAGGQKKGPFGLPFAFGGK
ncbi:hypothetical protein MNEG_4263 [Monoraphidium neglectum]|uniref:Senescence domain-containing protein n=1 Tax=Monoraphidium neglectum TaxID=145388 RepID=A0A0D2JYW1_9CHLO|nr:hypothetical protein MNEG_4263 [Monoraphidium neglectum]KIZ03693.1 hypothetical protein MNEG_4263 [Monoraphidium neglectum]|eukprot:XP_013902712.1 hypothetical protein MNEG_4263 [Monoraphidium neglectum]